LPLTNKVVYYIIIEYVISEKRFNIFFSALQLKYFQVVNKVWDHTIIATGTFNKQPFSYKTQLFAYFFLTL